MAHKALYRQFRPITFDDVIGQDNIINTLRNQIETNSVGHAYLFSGSRGTGKTTTSKVLSRAVNCLHPVNSNPCNQCDSCVAALTESSIDIIEMDAASHNGVDDIRELRENVKFAPSQSKYKVMIIDEVHMLSKGAFNALLKTLEEPPQYMIFILATTEPHKVPATIISRCQRFEFKRIDYAKINSHLKDLCNKLNIQVDDEAINLIIRQSEGAMRDALSLLEQCISFSGEVLTYEQTSAILGKSDDTSLMHFAQALIDNDTKLVLDLCKLHFKGGKEAGILLVDLIYLLRSVMIFKIGSADDYIILNQHETEWVLTLGDANVLPRVLYLLERLMELEAKIKYMPNPWIGLEVGLVKLCLSEQVQVVQQKANVTTIGKTHSSPNQGSQNYSSSNHNTAAHSNKSLGTSSNPQGSIIKSHVELDPQILQQLSIDVVNQHWDEFLIAIKRRLVSTYALMKEVTPMSFQDGVLKLYLNEMLKILKPAIENADNMQHIQQAFIEVYKCSPKIIILDEREDVNYGDQVKAYFSGIVDESSIIIK